jgi:hypothetical protein
MIVFRHSLLLVLVLCARNVAPRSEEAEMKSVKAYDIEARSVQVLGKTGLPIGTVFSGRLAIVDKPEKKSEVQLTVPTIGRTVSFGINEVSCFALDPEDKAIKSYDGKEVVAYEYLCYVGYPVDFWENKAPLVSPPKGMIAGFRTMLMVRFPHVRAGKIP